MNTTVISRAVLIVVLFCLASVSPGQTKSTTQPAIHVQFFNAIDHDQVEFVRKQLDAGTSVNATDAIGRSALAHACDNGAIETARLLIEKGADVNKPYEQPSEATAILPTPRIENLTPIYLAARSGAPAIVKLLIGKKADPNSEAIRHGMIYLSYEAPLAAAARSGNLETVKLLVSAGAIVQIEKKAILIRVIQPIDQAIESNAVEIAAFLADHGAKITDSHLLDSVKAGHAEMTSLCIKHGADLFQKTEEGDSLLAIAMKEHDSTDDAAEKAKFQQVLNCLREAGLVEAKK